MKMEEQTAEYLADETVRIFRGICRIGSEDTNGSYCSDILGKIDKLQIIKILSQANITSQSFELPYERSLKRRYLEKRMVNEDFMLRRVLRNEIEEDIELNGVRGWLGKRINWWKGFDAGEIARYALADPDIVPLIRQSQEAGNLYSLVAHWAKKEGVSPDNPIWVRRPIVIIPGAREEDLRALYLFSVRYQKPSKADVKSFTRKRKKGSTKTPHSSQA